MKRIIAFLTLIGVLCTMTAWAHPFSDVVGHWAEEEIERGYSNQILNGDPDGKFWPDDDITRAEFVKIVTATICERLGTEIPQFYEEDQMIHWAANYYAFTSLFVKTSSETPSIDGIKPGKMDTYEEFEMPIARWEMAYMLGQVLENVLGKSFTENGGTFKDDAEIMKLPEGISKAISGCSEFKLMMGDEKNLFNPKLTGSRAEAVTVVNRLDDIIIQTIETLEKEQAAAEEAYNQAIQESIMTYTDIPKGHPKVTMTMENGKKIELELYPEYAPQTVANFVKLAKDGFYNGLTFHRIVDGFMAQGGDPNGNGTGSAQHTIKGEFLANGFDKNTLSHTRGVISMARSSHMDSASSQFFICYDDAPFLDGQYAAFGKVTKGMEVVDAFLKTPRTANRMGEVSIPEEPVVIKWITVK